MPKQALGKGLGALIGKSSGSSPSAAPASDPAAGEQVLNVALATVQPSPLQPRKHIRQDQLDELTESIREHGVIQPLIVRKVRNKLELIAGERRWRACQALELTEVPVIIRKASDREVLEMALIENLQREDLNPIEEAEAYVRLAKEFKLRQEDIAQRVGKNRATVANSMRLLDLCSPVREHLAQGRLSIGHAKVLLGIKAAKEQAAIADMVIRKGMTVRATERLVAGQTAAKKSNKPRPSGAAAAAEIVGLQNRLRDHLATQVTIKHGSKRGKIEVEYYGNEDLERVMEAMGLK
ncbi:MAG: ParB/RepB/Spo0J family partition protein [Verrucomicrobiota bacterium]